MLEEIKERADREEEEKVDSLYVGGRHGVNDMVPGLVTLSIKNSLVAATSNIDLQSYS